MGSERARRALECARLQQPRVCARAGWRLGRGGRRVPPSARLRPGERDGALQPRAGAGQAQASLNSAAIDTLTHALSGALLARATAPKDAPPRSLPRRIAAGFFACAAPDLDIVFALAGPIPYLELHRGPTHSLVLLPFWALVYSWILAKILRDPRGWKALYGITAMGLALHVAGDLITSFGTQILWPISTWRAAIGTTYIIDPWFTGLIVAGLACSSLFKKSRLPSLAALALLSAYVGFQYVVKQKALDFGVEYAKAQGIAGAQVHADARPVSPFNWTVFVSDETTHRFAHVNLRREKPLAPGPGDGFIRRLDAAYLPLDQAIWVARERYGEAGQDLVREAWSSPAFGFFRWFALLPALDGASSNPACFWFTDLRFNTPGRPSVPFQFGACRAGPGEPWRAYERPPGGAKAISASSPG
jgi:inner membrane protein